MGKYIYTDRADAERLLMEQLDALLKAKKEVERGRELADQGARIKESASNTVATCRDAIELLVSEMIQRGDLPSYNEQELLAMRYTIAEEPPQPGAGDDPDDADPPFDLNDQRPMTDDDLPPTARVAREEA